MTITRIGTKITKLANDGVSVKFSNKSKAYEKLGLTKMEKNNKGYRYTFSLNHDSDKFVVNCSREHARGLMKGLKGCKNKEDAVGFIELLMNVVNSLNIARFNNKGQRIIR